MKPLQTALAVLAMIRVAMPIPAEAVVLVPGCGDGVGAIPLRIPMNNKEKSPCCEKLCHVNDRKRSSGHCCGPEDDPDDD